MSVISPLHFLGVILIGTFAYGAQSDRLVKNSSDTISGTSCPPDHIENSGMCAYTIMKPLLNTWRQTQHKCMQYDSKILMIKSNFEWKTLMAGAASQLNNAPAGVWLGLNYTKADDKFYWFDGTEYVAGEDWGLWAPDEIMKPDKDRCVLIEKTGEEERKFEWILVDCESPHMMGIGICFCMVGFYTYTPETTETTTTTPQLTTSTQKNSGRTNVPYMMGVVIVVILMKMIEI